MNEKDEYRPIARGTDHMCFGCSPHNPSGLKMTFRTNGESVQSIVSVPEHLCGWASLAHGGVLTAILDEIMTWAAIYLLKRVTVTKSMTIDFIKPVLVSQELMAEGKLVELKGRNEALMEGSIYDHTSELLTRSRGSFALLKPRVAQRLGVVDEKALKDFEPIFSR